MYKNVQNSISAGAPPQIGWGSAPDPI